MSAFLRRNDWRHGVLQDLVFFQRGFDITEAQQQPGPHPVVSSSGIRTFHNEFKIEGPGIVIGRKGTVGSVHFVDCPYWPHDTTLWSKELKGNDARFIYYFLHTIDFKRFDVGNSNPTLNRNHIHQLPICIPPLDVQHRIAEYLTAYDNLIENNRQRIKLLELAARLLFQEWFVHLRFPGHEHVRIINGVPEGWETRSAFESMEILSGGTPKTDVPDYWDGDIPFYTPKDAVDCVSVEQTEKQITERGLGACNSALYPRNTVLITARGTVGKVNLAGRPMTINQSCYALVAHAPLTQEFLYFSMAEAVEQLRSHAVGSVFDAIIRDTFKHISLITPTEALVAEFTEAVKLMLAMAKNLQAQNRGLVIARDLLLPRLMSGEVEV